MSFEKEGLVVVVAAVALSRQTDLMMLHSRPLTLHISYIMHTHAHRHTVASWGRRTARAATHNKVSVEPPTLLPLPHKQATPIMPPTPPAVVTAAPPSSARLLVCCKVYVSEGRNQIVLDRLAEVARTASPGLCALVQRFSDAVYHRSNFTLGGAPAPVLEVALRMIDEALGSLDMTTHSDATHPRVGAVDHVSFHPLGSTPLEAARDAAMQLGQRVGGKWPVPVLMYGACSSKSLAEVRRSTSYFKGLALDSEIPHPDFGPARVDPKLGLLCCGAVPYVQNYNIRLSTSEKAVAARVTRAVRSKDGGPEGVEALTLRHDGGHMEVACNLLDLSKTGPEKVLEVVREAAREEGVDVEEAYTIGMTGKEIWEETERLLREEGGEGGRYRM